MKRFVLLLSCVVLTTASVGCRCGGNPFSWNSSSSAPCCGSGETVGPTITPTITNYEGTIYDGTTYDGSSVMISPPEEVLPSPAR